MADYDSNSSVYKKLEDPSGQIRLLKILPHSDIKTSLCCQLETFSADDANRPQYTALSYTWGEPLPPCDILINGSGNRIRQNLFDFLQTASQDTKFCDERWLWIDQLCINQADEDEKKHQIRRMDRVYKDANDVIVWLGTGFQGSDDLIDYINLAPSNWSMYMKPEMYDHWGKLVQISYWSRLWICQEVILAKVITIWIGKSRIVWGQFQHHADENDLLTTIAGRPGAEHGAGCLRRLVEGRNRAKDEGPRDGLTWLQALNVQKGSACFLPHDKVFGLLGLVKEALRVEIDYHISMKELFFRVLERHMAEDARSTPWNIHWIPQLNSLAYFAKELRFELGLKHEISDAELELYLREELLRALDEQRRTSGWRETVKYPVRASRIRKWSRTFSSIRYIEGFDWNNYHTGPNAWRLLIPEELR